MSDTVTVARITNSDEGPAVWLEGWLPDIDAFPELTEARAEYLRLRNGWQSAGERVRDAQERIEAAASERQAALREAVMRGDSEPKVKDDSAKLRDELARAQEHVRAAREAYVEHINVCIALVVAHSDEWQAEVASFDASVDSEIRALMVQMTELRARHGHYARLAHWITRTVRGAELPAEHFPYSEIAPPPSGDAQEEDVRSQAAFERSYAGGLDPERRATEDEARTMQTQTMASRPQPVTETVKIVDYAQLEDDDLADWLTGTGGFDGQPRPTVQQVIAVAAGDTALAERLAQAENRVNSGAVRADLIDGLNETANGKVGA
jgi:hypothetical protein